MTIQIVLEVVLLTLTAVMLAFDLNTRKDIWDFEKKFLRKNHNRLSRKQRAKKARRK